VILIFRLTTDAAMATDQFRQLAAYSRWANARLYAAALDLSNQAYRLHMGVLFSGPARHTKSPAADRRPLAETVDRRRRPSKHPNQLNAILCDDRAELTRARIAEDNRLINLTRMLFQSFIFADVLRVLLRLKYLLSFFFQFSDTVCRNCH
jgi:hypothetical protein